ncbi:MAG: C40 family peptidase [Atopobiaceae bacterium]|nr:C40 family peptidase [Atopobiaceae bacterium]
MSVGFKKRFVFIVALVAALSIVSYPAYAASSEEDVDSNEPSIAQDLLCEQDDAFVVVAPVHEQEYVQLIDEDTSVPQDDEYVENTVTNDILNDFTSDDEQVSENTDTTDTHTSTQADTTSDTAPLDGTQPASASEPNDTLPEENTAANRIDSANDTSSRDAQEGLFEDAALEDQATASAPITKVKSADALVLALTSAGKEGWVKNGSNYRFVVAGTPVTGWLLTSVAPGSQRLASQERYWLDTTGIMASARLVTATESGWWAYAKESGAIATNYYKEGDKVYLADSNGKLANPGWLVTDAYSKGTTKRYYIENSTHSAVLGFSKSGYAHYTLEDGSVFSGGTYKVDDKVYLADKTGKLANPGWLVSSGYGQGLQRYYIESDYAAHVGFSTKGYAHYTRPEGYVALSPYKVGNLVYLADNDGRVETKAGWHITAKFGQGYQRYWVVSGKNAAQIGFFSTGGKQYYTRDEGYVLRGKLQLSEGVLLANNDGVLATGTGWLITKDYDSQLQRYYLIRVDGHSYAKLGLFTVGTKQYFGIDGVGYELRNATKTIEGIEYKADNDGVLTPTKPIVSASTKSSVIESYIKWALDIAADDSHGYSQYNRWGPDYDCSSLVISALEAAGLDTGYATYTGNMRSQLTKHGFVWMTDLSAITRGDILLNEVQHTAIYLGNSKMVEATMSETRGIDGKTGDQTGTEITVNPYRNANWDGFLRYSG